MTTSSASKKGLLLVLAAALLLSIGGLCVKMIPWQPLSINAFRSIISVGILLVFAKATHNRCKLTPGVLIGALGVCGATTLYTVSTKLTTAGNAVLLQFTAPMFVILFMWLVFREKPNRLDVGACLLIFGGVLCFFLDSLGSGRFVGDVLAVASGACYSWVFMLNKLPGGNPVWATILGQLMGVGIGLPSLVQETQFDGTSLFYGVLLGVFQLGLCLCMPDHGHPVREAHHSLPGHGDRAGAQPHSGGPGGGGGSHPSGPVGRGHRVYKRHGLQRAEPTAGKAASGSSHPGTRPAQQKGVAPC